MWCEVPNEAKLYRRKNRGQTRLNKRKVFLAVVPIIESYHVFNQNFQVYLAKKETGTSMVMEFERGDFNG